MNSTGSTQAKWMGRYAAVALLALAEPLSAGTITGGLAYPGDKIPALTVVAVEQGSGKQYTVATRPGQRTYRLEVPAGRYLVFALPRGAHAADEAPKRGAYTAASACILSTTDLDGANECHDHQLLTVEVSDTELLRQINVYDWFLPAAEHKRILAISVEAP